MKKILLLVFAVVVPANAYYYFVNYLPGGNAPEKFDLTALPAKTVTFLVSETGPTNYSATDSFNSMLGQVRRAAAIWNGVTTSDLRVAFGGLENSSTQQGAPGGDIVFDDLPPGVEGFGGPTSLASPVTAANGTQFFPILRSTIHLNQNLVLAPGPSFNQSFLLTTVHEMGHALGLQHTFTSAAMSQATTRATSLTRPIDNDDIAGISALYPNSAFKQQFGSITGKVTAGGKGVHMASVVALPVGAGAISAVTNPDGSFEMDGVPPGSYTIYVHTMPPDADIYGPWNADGSVAAASGPINTVFYSLFGAATSSYSQAFNVSVTAGNVSSGVTLASNTRSAVPVYDGQVFGFFGNTAIIPAPVNITNSLVTVVASVVGLGSNGQAPGLTVQIPGGASVVRSNGVRPYLSNGYTYIALDLNFATGAQPGPQHMVFSTSDYTYVLPSAMYLTQSAPPTISAAAANGDGTVTVTGASWNAATQIYFDSLPANITSLDLVNQIAVVVPPAGSSGQQATLTAYNIDGQNSQFLELASPVTFSYGILPAPSISTISPSSLAAGAEAVVDITGSGFSFNNGANSLGFGTSDIVVRRIFALSPNHLQADVSVLPAADQSTPDVTLISGFAMATAPAGFLIGPSFPGLPSAIPILTNSVAGLTGAYPGASVNLSGSSLSLSSAVPPVVIIGGVQAAVTAWSATQLTLVIPSSLAPGPATLSVNNGQIGSYTDLVNIDPLPAAIDALQRASDGAYIYSAQPAHIGDTLIVTLSNFAPGVTPISPASVQIGLGGALLAPTVINQIDGVTQISFVVGKSVPTGASEQFVVYFNGMSSYAASIQVLP